MTSPESARNDRVPPPALLRFRLIPTLPLLWLFLFGLCTLALLLPPFSPSKLLGAGLLAPLAALMALVSARRRGVLTLDDQIRYRRGKVQIQVPRGAALAVVVHRPNLPLRQPTTYSLRVRAGQQELVLPFAEHWLLGGSTWRDAGALAQALQVPVLDPVGELRRASRFAAVRWMGQGQEWRLVLLSVLFTLTLGLLLKS